MSAKDSMAKEYFADNARFADLCNNILYGGREVILPENLKERDTTEVLTALGLDKKTIAMQKLRDIFKNASIKYTGKSYVVLIGHRRLWMESWRRQVLMCWRRRL